MKHLDYLIYQIQNHMQLGHVQPLELADRVPPTQKTQISQYRVQTFNKFQKLNNLTYNKYHIYNI